MMSRGQSAIVASVIAALFLALVLPLALSGGTSAEEAVGLTSVAPERWYPDESEVSRSERRAAPGLRSSHRIPVWGHVSETGRYRPIMIDSHQSAWSFYPSRVLAAIGGLPAARIGTAATGLLMLLCIFLVGRLVGGTRVGIAATILAATSGLFVWAFSWVRPDEQLDSLCHLGVVIAAVRYAESERVRWFFLGCLLLGAGVAAKNTAAWTAIAMFAAAGMFRVLPRARLWQWITGGVVCLVPLVPQLLFMALGDDTGAMSSRLSTVSAPWEGLAPTQLAFSLGHFAESFGSGGALIASYVSGGTIGIPLVGYLVLAAVLIVVGGAVSPGTPRAARVFGAGLGLLLLQYLALYYHGESFWLLVMPWVFIAVAMAGVSVWNAARAARSSRVRRAACAAVIAGAVCVVGNNGLDVVRLHRAMHAPSSAMFSLPAQRWAVTTLRTHDATRPLTTTYGLVGTLELLGHGALRPRHLFPYFHRAGDRPNEVASAWQRILARLGPGTHTIVLTPNPSTVETSPLKRGALIAASFDEAVRQRGGTATRLAVRRGQDGTPMLEIVRVVLPLSPDDGPPSGSSP